MMANDNNKTLSSIFSVLVSGHHASCLESAAESTVAQILVPERPGDERQRIPRETDRTAFSTAFPDPAPSAKTI
jgi:hypothetical protein